MVAHKCLAAFEVTCAGVSLWLLRCFKELLMTFLLVLSFDRLKRC